ncbi:restriction endonuclease [Arthrobacter sp. zg-Y750]|uniref:restriction endonuclease n=1 Tax=Arthrobacter sp. zg-Y750 TaxID=2894189 RepID=UPI001E4B1C51|nr:restriction endonuclease [Arthrobacter sp. zg-Y750]MCC9178621.1 restriction endonuclease [Arthrobacter sp. zg-Y750]
MSETAVTGDDMAETSDHAESCRPVLRRNERIFVCVYSVLLALVVGGQTLCLSFMWRPPQDWLSFGARFVTSPAIAGLFAVVAASIGAWQLSKQLTHTKEKAADEAWWQQFEWVTDRIISSGDKEQIQLPSSLAFDLMTSLSSSARAPFQKDAVGGILTHFLERNEGLHGRDKTTTSDAAPNMDSAGASSLRTLLNVLPESSPSSTSARQVLANYDYEQEILKALLHRGFDVVLPNRVDHSGIDAIITSGSKKVIVDVKLTVRARHHLLRAVEQLKNAMHQERTTYGAIITRPTRLDTEFVSSLSIQGIHLVEWEPSMGSLKLSSQIKDLLGEKDN